MMILYNSKFLNTLDFNVKQNGNRALEVIVYLKFDKQELIDNDKYRMSPFSD